MPFKIVDLWAYISENEYGEGLCGFQDPNTGFWVPMVAGDEARLKSLLPFAKRIASCSKVKIVKFTHREDIGEV